MVVTEHWGRFEVAVALAGLATLSACGGSSGKVVDQPAPTDATTPADAETEVGASIPSGEDGGLDACACSDATAADAPLAIDGADGADGADAMPALDDICHVVWPQPPHLVVPGSQIAVDPQGNAYLAVSYYGETNIDPPPTIDFGVAHSGSYPVGVAIAKVDSACHLLWMREIGGSTAASVENGQITVDAQSNVTIMGTFQGAVDFDGTMLDSPDAAGSPSGSFPYLVRFDASGNVLYTKVFGPTGHEQEVSAGVLRLGDDGTSTVVVIYWSLAALLSDAGGPVVEEDFLQLDPTGAVVSQSSVPTPGPWFSPLVADPDGGMWGMQAPANGLYTPDAPVVLAHLSGEGAVDWTQSIDASAPSSGIVAGTGKVVLFALDGFAETLSAYSRTGTLSWTQTTSVAYAGGMFAERLLIDSNGAPIVAGEFFGTTVTSVDGSTGTDPTPSGMGFQAFDSTGHFRSVKTWNGAPADASGFGDVAVDSQGNVLLLGTTGSGQERSGVFFAKLTQ
jgi:hypothetical protein